MGDLPGKWQKSNQSIRAVQLAFEFSKTVADTLRNHAHSQGLSPSDQIREIIGLETKKPKRPRLTVSLTPEDYQLLAQRYKVSPDDKSAIRKAIADELVTYSQHLRPGAEETE